MTDRVSAFPLPSSSAQADLIECHGLDMLLYYPNAWALRRVFINQETGKRYEHVATDGIVSIVDLAK